MNSISPRKYRVYKAADIDSIPGMQRFGEAERSAMRAVAQVLPFRVNNYVTEELIDWGRAPDDPIFQLTIPQPGMLAPSDLQLLTGAMGAGADNARVRQFAREIQVRMNPHPAGQNELNVPKVGGEALPGMQHKYRETVLFFPSQGQTCHAYCTYCFRWAQFVGLDELKFASREAEGLVAYLEAHREVTSVLFTGGDPLVMTTKVLRRYVEALLKPELAHITSIRIGTKAPAYWPYRFVTDSDADDLLRLFEEVVAAGKQMAIMAHFSHPRELETPIAQLALRRIQRTGAVVRCQAPLIRRVNDDPMLWADMWRLQVQLGTVPYYMFVERDTGPKDYFGVPLARALEIFSEAYRHVSGLARTVRGPSMSCTPGKVLIDGVLEVGGRPYFVLRFLQARDPAWVGRPFLAEHDRESMWFDQLRPAEGRSEFFFEAAMRDGIPGAPAWGVSVPARRGSPVHAELTWE